MDAENTIEIKHFGTSFLNRIKHYIFIYIGIVSVFSLLSISKPNNEFLTFIGIVSLVVGLFMSYKIYQTKLYLLDFYSDSEKIKIRYYNGSKEQYLESIIEKVEVKLKNTSSRAGFSCEMKIKINGLPFFLNKDFDWNFKEMKLLFEYIKNHNKSKLTEKEKFIISRIENYLKHNRY